MVRKGSAILRVDQGEDGFSLSAPFRLAADVTLPETSDLEDVHTFHAYVLRLMAQSAELGVPVHRPVTAIYAGQDPALMTTWSPENSDGGNDLIPRGGVAA